MARELGISIDDFGEHVAGGSLASDRTYVEAHNPQREMFGFPRLRRLVAEHVGEGSLVDFLMDEVHSFTSEGWEQEDDITLVTLRRLEP